MKKFLAAAIIVGNLFLSSTVDAEIKVYTATGEEISNAFESEEVTKSRALHKAIKTATERAIVDFKTFELSDDEVLAIIGNSFELGGVEYNKADKIWHAKAEIKIDDTEVKNFLRRSDREKFTLINQTLDTQKIFAVNEKRVENLRARIENISKREEKKFFKAEFGYVDNEFLSNQKIAAGNKFFYRGRIDDAIKLYTEAIELNEYSAAAYNLRGNLYNVLAMNQQNVPIAESNRRQAINDLDKAIRLDNNYAAAFSNRGFVYYSAELFGQAIKDLSRAIQLEPNQTWNYIYRGQCYRQTDKNLALNDFNKAVELAPNASYAYSSRGNFYEQDLKDFSKALEDYSRAIELSRQSNTLALNYDKRGGVYRKLKIYDKAIADYSQAISLLESQSKKNPLLPWAYRKRGECYQAIGDNANAQADFKKFGELQRM